MFTFLKANWRNERGKHTSKIMGEWGAPAQPSTWRQRVKRKELESSQVGDEPGWGGCTSPTHTQKYPSSPGLRGKPEGCGVEEVSSSVSESMDALVLHVTQPEARHARSQASELSAATRGRSPPPHLSPSQCSGAFSFLFLFLTKLLF